MGRVQLLDVLDAAYDLDADAEAWMVNVCASALRVFPNATGALAYRYNLVGRGPALTSGVVGNVEYLEVPDEGHDSVSVDSIMRAYSAPSHAEPTTVFHADPTTGKAPSSLLQMWSRHDVADMFGVYATRPGGESMTIGIGMPRVSYPDMRSPELRPISRDWTNVARHLEHALSLREAVATGGIVAEFDANGVGDFRMGAEDHRQNLLALAQRTECARAEADCSGVEIWEQLLRGRWSIVRFRRANGRLRFLAIENPRFDNLRALTPTERAVMELVAAGKANKVIAIDLDLHLSSVGNIIARAMRKLGIENRVHVVALARISAGVQ